MSLHKSCKYGVFVKNISINSLIFKDLELVDSELIKTCKVRVFIIYLDCLDLNSIKFKIKNMVAELTLSKQWILR